MESTENYIIFRIPRIFRCLWRLMTNTVWITQIPRQDLYDLGSSGLIGQANVNYCQINAYLGPYFSFIPKSYIRLVFYKHGFFFFNRRPGVIGQKLRPHDLRGCAEVYKVAVGVQLPTFLNTWHSSKDKVQIRRSVVLICGSRQWITVTERGFNTCHAHMDNLAYFSQYSTRQFH